VSILTDEMTFPTFLLGVVGLLGKVFVAGGGATGVASLRSC